jgi:UDP-2,3-diacylglucosamine pyrophosphatase LpxH
MPLDAVLVSDVHVNGPECERQAAFVRFLASLPTDAPPTVVLLGDIFHIWWHRQGEPFREHLPVVQALQRFPLVFLPGNHDFHAPAFFRTLGATVPERSEAIGASLLVQLGALPAWLTHGDQVDESFGFRALHAVLRSRMFNRVMQAGSVEQNYRFLQSLAGHAKGGPAATAVVKQHALGANYSGGVQLVAMGHTHTPELVQHGGYRFLNTGDWVEHRTFATVRGEQVTLERFDG